jgi:hypothetical protein
MFGIAVSCGMREMYMYSDENVHCECAMCCWQQCCMCRVVWDVLLATVLYV